MENNHSEDEMSKLNVIKSIREKIIDILTTRSGIENAIKTKKLNGFLRV